MNRTKFALILCSFWLALFWPASRLLAYRDLETGTFLTRDPAGMVDGPNLYAYVRQNPWTKFDPEGLETAAVSRWALHPETMPNTQAFGEVTAGTIEVTGKILAATTVVVAGVALTAGNPQVAVSYHRAIDPTASDADIMVRAQGQWAVNDAFSSIGVPGVAGEHGVTPEDSVTKPYSQLTKDLKGTDGQAHHINQDGIYGGAIPTKDGAAFPLRGNAITDVGSPHYDAHAAMEPFLDQYRPGGAMQGQVPTNAEFLQNSQKALQAAGVPEPSARRVIQEAAAQQEHYGLRPNDPVPNIPAKLNQAKPNVQPNAPPVSVEKNQP